jgi:triacylglycerol lipase
MKSAPSPSMLPQPLFARLDAPIVLAHGLFGFTRIGVGPLTLTWYFRGIPQALEAAGNRVLVTRVQPIAGVERRARRLGEQIVNAFGDEPVHLIGHSMGGLDARRLLADESWQKRILSITTIGTPHLGTSLADFAKLRVGRVYRLLEALKIDPQGFVDVTRKAARRFHERFAPPPIPCFSVAGDPPPHEVCWPLRRLHAVLSEIEGPNDGVVSVESANAFGRPLPVWPVDHLRQVNWLAPAEHATVERQPLELHAEIVEHLASLGFGRRSQPEPPPVLEPPPACALAPGSPIG